MYKRYQGNSGRMEWVEEHAAPPPPFPAAAPPPFPPPPERPGFLSGLLGRFLPGLREGLETEDLLLLLILYLLYRESGDTELLILLGAMLLL